MPAASWRIIPARSIRRCDTISASFGFSLRMGRKNRDNRIVRPGESLGEVEASSETGSGAKTQGQRSRKRPGNEHSCCFAGEFDEGKEGGRAYKSVFDL